MLIQICSVGQRMSTTFYRLRTFLKTVDSMDVWHVYDLAVDAGDIQMFLPSPHLPLVVGGCGGSETEGVALLLSRHTFSPESLSLFRGGVGRVFMPEKVPPTEKRKKERSNGKGWI